MTGRISRFDAIDSARGIGIILVVFGHAWRGAFGAGLLPDTALFAAIDRGIYAFHMPLFFFLSGLLFLDTLAKYRAGVLLKGRVTRLLWPMALWTWLFFGLKLMGGASVNAPVSLADMPVIPLPPYEHLWFLWALFLCQSLVIVLYAALLHRLPRQALEYGAGGIALGMAISASYVAVLSLIWGPMVAHLPYFLLGIGFGRIHMERSAGYVSALGAVAFGTLMYTVVAGIAPAAGTFSSLALLICFWIAWSGVDRGGRARALSALRYLGNASMVIYLTHTVFSAALRIVLVKVGVDEVTIILFATTIVGLVASLAVLWVARKMRAVKLLGF